MCNSEPPSRLRGLGFNKPHFSARANSKLASVIWKAKVLRIALQNNKSSARAEARARTNVGQSVRLQPSPRNKPAAARRKAVALPPGLQLELGMRTYRPSNATPNPSVEGTAKRLRLSSAPHLERWASPLATRESDRCLSDESPRKGTTSRFARQWRLFQLGAAPWS